MPASLDPRRLPAFVVAVSLVCAAGGCAPDADGGDPGRSGSGAPSTDLTGLLEARAAGSGAEVGLVYATLEHHDPAQPGGDQPRSGDGRSGEGVRLVEQAVLNPHLRMHAASTMKVPVMIQLYLDQAAGLLDLDAPMMVSDTFVSIVDGSTYVMDASSDSDATVYEARGGTLSRRHLMDRMITWSSNLATNLLIADVDARRVTETMRGLGADSMEVLRGVEDIPAFRAGLNNTTTARDLARVMAAVSDPALAGEAARDEMLGILERQHFRENIPAGLPEGTRVANKTGWITGINHDAAVVFPDGAPPYVLVVLLRGHPAEDQGTAFAAELSRLVHEHHMAVFGAS